jgi:hypothetical protein
MTWVHGAQQPGKRVMLHTAKPRTPRPAAVLRMTPRCANLLWSDCGRGIPRSRRPASGPCARHNVLRDGLVVFYDTMVWRLPQPPQHRSGSRWAVPSWHSPCPAMPASATSGWRQQVRASRGNQGMGEVHARHLGLVDAPLAVTFLQATSDISGVSSSVATRAEPRCTRLW